MIFGPMSTISRSGNSNLMLKYKLDRTKSVFDADEISDFPSFSHSNLGGLKSESIQFDIIIESADI